MERDRQNTPHDEAENRRRMAHSDFQTYTLWNCHYYHRKQGGGPPSYKGRECFCPSLPVQLLSLCCLIHDEVIPILYGRNKFKFTNAKPGGLVLLRTLNHRALRSMTSLHISLYDLGENNPLDRETSEGVPIIQDLGVLCQRMTQYIPVSQMRFSLACNPIDLNTALKIRSAVEIVPVLKSCAIRFGPWQEPDWTSGRCGRLGSSPDVKLRQLARKTSLWLVGISSANLSTPFPFNRLPPEIRRRVLNRSDLVTHYDQTQWDYDGMHIHDGRIASVSACCTKCSDCLESCFCSVGSAAFSTTCVCYKFPTAFFRVSRQISQEASEDFLLQNRFIFTGEIDITLNFLRSRIAWLSQLRKIDFKLDKTQVRNWRSRDQKSWRMVVGLVKKHSTLSRLWVIIDAGGDKEACRSAAANNREEELQAILTTYERIIEPWQEVKGLLKFHVFLSWFPGYAATAERQVMAYDSANDWSDIF